MDLDFLNKENDRCISLNSEFVLNCKYPLYVKEAHILQSVNKLHLTLPNN